MKMYSQHPDAKLDYSVDWTDFLGADTIDSSSWEAPAELTLTASSNNGTAATIWIEGGTLGETYEVSNSIITAAGREDTRTILIRIEIL